MCTVLTRHHATAVPGHSCGLLTWCLWFLPAPQKPALSFGSCRSADHICHTPVSLGFHSVWHLKAWSGGQRSFCSWFPQQWALLAATDCYCWGVGDRLQWAQQPLGSKGRTCRESSGAGLGICTFLTCAHHSSLFPPLLYPFCSSSPYQSFVSNSPLLVTLSMALFSCWDTN